MLVMLRSPEPVEVIVVVLPAESVPFWNTLPPDATVMAPVVVTLPLKVTLVVASCILRLATVRAA